MRNHMLFALSGWALAVVFAGYCAFFAVVLNAESNANKAQPETLLCFNGAGQVTRGSDWTECKTVRFHVIEGQ